mmetsp:Transcript_24605/g.79539  ORF Transcript_24605/g.79539 Transcript_24605/m.79539 type:complete len:152 (-) Transcript_24605:304-759(-)
METLFCAGWLVDGVVQGALARPTFFGRAPPKKCVAFDWFVELLSMDLSNKQSANMTVGPESSAWPDPQNNAQGRVCELVDSSLQRHRSRTLRLMGLCGFDAQCAAPGFGVGRFPQVKLLLRSRVGPAGQLQVACCRVGRTGSIGCHSFPRV